MTNPDNVSNDVLNQLRAALKPKGTAPLVRLALKDNSYFDESFVKGVLSALSMRLVLINVGMDDPLSPLEQLGLRVLLDSAGIDPENLR